MANAPGFQLLEQTEEDEAAGLYPIQAPGGTVVRLTARQVEILSMPLEKRRLISEAEMAEVGKILMTASQSNVDAVLHAMDNAPVEIPEFVPEPFEYTALSSSTSIRLIQMLPEDENGMLQMRLDEYDLDGELPNYYFLSYCWGNPHARSNLFNSYETFASDYDEQATYPVACNGRLLFLRANLYDALQQLPAVPGLELKSPENVDGTPRFINALHEAAILGDVGLVKTNLFRGANIDARDTNGCTALILATMKGHTDITKILLNAGSNPQIRDYDGKSCLDYGIDLGRHEIVDLLLTFDASRVKTAKRSRKHDGKDIKIWIDAICINQNDIEEKSMVVGTMDKICSHQNARYVSVWLGKDDGLGGSAVGAIEKLYPAFASRIIYDSGIIPYKNVPPTEYARAGIPYVTNQEWIALASLFLRQNFIRLWCLQEVVLPKNIVMYLGPYEIPWHEFIEVADGLSWMQSKFTISPSSKFRSGYSHHIEAEACLISELRRRKFLDEASTSTRDTWFESTQNFWRGDGKLCQIPLLEMIFRTITFKCYDPRDHIYALIGLCRNHPESPQIEVDYAKPFEEIYADITRMMFEGLRAANKPSLEVVACIKDSSERNNDKLPSWVPHFGEPGLSTFWAEKFSAAGNASTLLDTVHGRSGQSHELVLFGQRVDTIRNLATKRPGRQKVSMFNLDTAWPSLLLDMPQIYPHTKQPRTEALWRTLCSDTPATDDIIRSRSAANDSDSVQVLTTDSVAPAQYATQFRDQYCAMILAHAEQSAHLALKMRTTRPGVLLQALMGLQIRRNTDDPTPFTVKAPTDEEVAKIRDTSLESSYFADPKIRQSLSDLFLLEEYDNVSTEGPGCFTPSRLQVEAFISDPPFRVWLPGPMNASDYPFNPNVQSKQQAADTQIMDDLPLGEDGFRAQFGRYHGGRRLFVTEGERFIGLGPMSMQKDDEIWVVKGSRVPVLLRRCEEENSGHGDKSSQNVADDMKESSASEHETFQQRKTGKYFKLIGDLYVHGVMHGEAVKEEEDWDEIILS